MATLADKINKKMKLKQTATVNDEDGSPKEPQSLKEHLFRHQFKKTQLCRYFVGGKCKSGRMCSFAHGVAELSTAPDLAKTSRCTAWMAGKCNKGDECKFAHGSKDLRMTPLFQVCLPTTRTPKNITAVAAPPIEEIDKSPSKSNTSPLPMSPYLLHSVASMSTTGSDINQMDSPSLADTDQSDDSLEASDGAELHPTAECTPCAWNWRPGGCVNGSNCKFCHICPEGSLKQVRKKTENRMKQERKIQAKTPPQSPVAKGAAKVVHAISPGQQLLMGMQYFAESAPMAQRVALSTLLQNSARAPYYD